MGKIAKMLIVSSLGILLITGCGKKVEEQENINTNGGVVQNKVVEGLELTNTSLVSEEHSAVLVTQVKNPTSEDKEVRIFNIYVKDKDGNIITTLQGYVGGVIPAGEIREITSNSDKNLDNAYDIEYEVLQ